MSPSPGPRVMFVGGGFSLSNSSLEHKQTFRADRQQIPGEGMGSLRRTLRPLNTEGLRQSQNCKVISTFANLQSRRRECVNPIKQSGIAQLEPQITEA